MKPQEADRIEVRAASSDRSRLRSGLKRVIQHSFWLLVAHRLLAFRIASLFLGRERAFSAASESIARVPGTRGLFARQLFYSRTLANCGRDVYFGWLSVFSTSRASVADRVYIGRRCSIGFAQIGEQTLLADGVQILSGARQHASDSGSLERQAQPQVYRKVTIGRDSWLGTNAIVMADVGAGSTVGAGAVVTKAVPPKRVAVGVPARVIEAS